MGTFGDDTAVEPIGEGSFRGTITDRWGVLGSAPNGGYLMAIAARAMASRAEHPDPVTVTAHFLRPPAPGEVTVEVDVVKSGRRHTHLASRLLQDGRECVRLLGAFADLAAVDGPTKVDREPPVLPPIEACVDPREGDDAAPSIVHRFDHRIPPATLGWATGQPDGTGEMRGWCRLADGEELDPLALLVVADAYPPAVFNSGAPVGWTPTVEMTVQIRKRPSPGWLANRFWTAHLTGGYLEEDGEMWDAAGDLVALSRQLALAARPG